MTGDQQKEQHVPNNKPAKERVEMQEWLPRSILLKQRQEICSSP